MSGGMTGWEKIACQRDHEHHSRLVEIDLSERHGYRDLPAVPARLARKLRLNVWDTDWHPVDGGPYCPAHDAVSETLLSHGIWEPRETCLTLDVCERADPAQVMGDFGAQVGWFTFLAASCGVSVHAFEPDTENARLLMESAREMGVEDLVTVHRERVGPRTPRLSLGWWRLVKIDVEGAEADCVRVLEPALDAGLVDHLLIEVSPVFIPGGHYPDLLGGLVDRGFELYVLPEKRHAPRPFLDAESYLAPYRLDTVPDWRSTVAGWHQEDVWAKRRGARW